MFILMMTVFPAALTAAEVSETSPAWPTGIDKVSEHPSAKHPVTHPADCHPFPDEPTGLASAEHPVSNPHPFPFPGV
jgi:hypothetical protein